MSHSDESDDNTAAANVVAANNALIGDNDLEGVLALYEDDARMFPPTGPVVEGKAAIRTFMQAWPSYRSSKASDISVEVGNDLAVATCAVSIVHASSDGTDRRVSAKQMLTLHRQNDGRWLISAIIFNAEPAS
ncbi:MAG: SgcJ/EcaC family oxidoreductase [Actinomycetota bacterium]